MYSVVLMMAMTTGGETPELGKRGGDGCQGGRGGLLFGGGGLFGGRRGGGGCYGDGGCYGGGYSGCGCYGGYSGYSGHACYGAYSGHSCYGGAVIGSCYGGAIHHGCYGGTIVVPKEMKKLPDGKEEKKDPEKIGKPPVGSAGSPARLIVSMPADATFTIDNYTSPARSDTHIVVSGPLATEESKTYVLKAEVVRDGKTQTIEERVTVRGGEEKKVALTLPATVAAR